MGRKYRRVTDRTLASPKNMKKAVLDMQPYPKAPARKLTNRGRRQTGRCMIATDTPEKELLAQKRSKKGVLPILSLHPILTLTPDSFPHSLPPANKDPSLRTIPAGYPSSEHHHHHHLKCHAILVIGRRRLLNINDLQRTKFN